jgi:predicted ribosomally synthesized peptide with nif11-like leader
MSLDQLKAFLGRMDNDFSLRQAVMAAATADDVAQIAAALSYEFSGDELLRLSGQKVGRVKVTKQDIPGEYNRARSIPPFLDWYQSEKEAQWPPAICRSPKP